MRRAHVGAHKGAGRSSGVALNFVLDPKLRYLPQIGHIGIIRRLLKKVLSERAGLSPGLWLLKPCHIS